MQDRDLTFQNILVIDFGQLGDVVLSLPALAAVRQRFPGSHITVLTGKVPGEVIKLSGMADESITVDRVELRDGPKGRSIGKILKFVAEVRRRSFDLIIDLHSLPETNILAWLSPAPQRLLANRESRSLDSLSNFRPRPPKEDKDKHLSARYMDVLAPLGIGPEQPVARLTAPAADAGYINDKYFPDAGQRIVGLFPGAGHPSRCWALKKFVELAARLAEDGARPVVFLGPEEAAMRDEVARAFSDRVAIIDGLTISQFIAAAARLSAFVTNDTGPMHLAACAGAPVVLLIDGRAPTTYLPLTRRLITVRDRSIDAISVESVYAAVTKLLAE